MTVEKISGVQHYIGLSTDTKPSTQIHPGSTFFETDTGLRFEYGHGSWGVEAASLAGGDVSIVNSTATPLPGDTAGSDHVFTGESVRIIDVAMITLNVFSDVASATDGLRIEQSSDGTNWDHLDEYSIPADNGKVFTPNKAAEFMRVVYINGITPQTEFRLQTILNYVNGKASSHRVNDDISAEDDAPITIAVIKVPTNDPNTLKNADLQNPFPTDGDSVYAKDMSLDNSTIGTFSGNLLESLFNDYDNEIEDISATNPKTYTVRFRRPISTTQIGFGSLTGDFSNVKVELKDLAGTVRGGFDNSSDNTKFTSAVFPLAPITFIEMVVEFHTTDPVKISGMFIPKDLTSVARIQGLKPDGTVVDFEATAGGNFKISLEEYDEALEVDPLPVRDATLEIARGGLTGITHVNKYGRAEDGIQLTETDIWDRADASATQQIYLAPTAARIHTLVSSSAADDGTPEGAGAGAQQIRIWYLPDWDTKETFEDVVLNGVAGVAMQNAAVIINRMKVIALGSTYGINAGIITATAAVDVTVSSQINVGNGQTNQAILGIPSVQTAYATGFDLNSHNTANPASPIEVDFTLLANENPDLDTTVFLNKGNVGTIATGSTYISRKYNPYRVVGGPAIVKMQATATVADTEGVAEFDMILVDN